MPSLPTTGTSVESSRSACNRATTVREMPAGVAALAPPVTAPLITVTSGERANSASMNALAEADSTAMNEIRASPIISVDAVAAVRSGLRMTISRASAPGRRRPCATGSPAAPASGRATSGPASLTPISVNAAPASNRKSTLVATVSRTTPMPAATSAAPTDARAADPRRPRATGTSRSAASGAARLARRVGASADSSMTTTPASREQTTVRGDTTSTWPRTSPEIALELTNARSAAATPTPMPSPASDAAAPTIVASSHTRRRSWLGSAPRQRNSASSRVR
jgi:hypothetical protein